MADLEQAQNDIERIDAWLDHIDFDIARQALFYMPKVTQSGSRKEAHRWLLKYGEQIERALKHFINDDPREE